MKPQTGIAGFVTGFFIAASGCVAVVFLILPVFAIWTWLETGELSRVDLHALLLYTPQSIIWGGLAWMVYRTQFPPNASR